MIDRNLQYWFPLRVSYSHYTRLVRLKEEFDKLQMENYVAMTYRKIGFTMKLVPAINNIIFVRSTYQQLSEVKREPRFDDIRYIMHQVYDDKEPFTEPLYVPDRQMNDFIRVSSVHDNRVAYMDNLEYAFREGLYVEIMDGYFTGVRGIVKRIDGSKGVVVPLREIAAIAIRNVPSRYLRVLTPSEIQDLSPSPSQ